MQLSAYVWANVSWRPSFGQFVKDLFCIMRLTDSRGFMAGLSKAL